MKKNIFATIISLVLVCAFFSCCKKEEVPVPPVNYLIAGLDPNTKLPNSDTTNAFAFIQGEINGIPFSMVDGKDNVEFRDYATNLFTTDYTRDSVKIRNNALYATWRFIRLDSVGGNPFGNSWEFDFELPAIKPTSIVELNQFKRNFTTLNHTFPFGDNGILITDYTTKIAKAAAIEILRYDSNLPTGGAIRNTSSPSTNQSSSYVKLVSITKHNTLVNGYYYELHYEFEANLGSDANKILLTKGKAKVWVADIIY